MILLKKIIGIATVISIIVSVISVPVVNASENKYAITSGLKDGWTNGYIGRELVLDAKLGTDFCVTGGTVEIGDDKSAVTVSRILGREGIVLSPDLGTSARYLNVNVDNKIVRDVRDGTSFAVEIDYYDKGKSSMTVEYPCMDYVALEGERKAAEFSQPKLNKDVKTAEEEYLVFSDTGVWKTYTWFLDNPTMNDSLGGFDLRTGIYSNSMGYTRDGEVVVSGIRVYKLKTASRIKIESDTSEHFGNIFYKGQPIELLTSFSSEIYPLQNGADCTLDTVYTIRSEDGTVVQTCSDSFTLPARSKTVRRKKFNVDKFGIYRVDVECYSKDKKVYSRLGTEFSYVNSDMGKTVNPKAGVQIALANVNDRKIAKLARNAGFAHARMMCYYYNWRKSAEDYEINNVSVPGAFHSLLRSFKEAGLTVNVNLHSASWMGSAYNFSPTERTPPYTDNGLRRWADYVGKMTELFGDTVDCIEIWNEYNLGPNHSFNIENRPASDYGKMYEISKKAVKAVNPNMPVIAMNTSGVARDWAEGVFKSGVTDIDVYACHPYQWYGDPIKYDSLANIENGHKLMEEYGIGDRPMWVGEYGYSSHYEEVDSDTEQGNYNAQSYALIMGQGYIDRFYFYCLLDKANPVRTDRESNFGMVRCDTDNPRPYTVPYAAKSGYLILSNMNMLYHDAEFAENINYSDTSRVVRSRSKSSGKDLAMLFSNKDEGEMITLNLGTDTVTLIDSYGNAKTVSGSGGVFSFCAGKEVQYISGSFKRFESTDTKVSPESANIDILYGEDAKIKIINKSGKEIYARVQPSEGSGIRPQECIIPKNGGNVVIKGTNALAGIESVRLTLDDGKDTFYCGNVNLLYKNIVSLTTTLIPLESGWSMRCILKNHSDLNTVGGRLTLLTPVAWKEKIGDIPVALAPEEEKTFDLTLPVGTSADDSVIEMGFVTNEDTGMGDYVSRNYNFSAAVHADTPIVIDGVGNEWTEGFINLNRSDQFHSLISLGNPYFGAEDLSAKAAIKWDDDNFYLYADVLDNKHFSTGVEPVNIWQMDSIQLGIVYDPESELGRSDFEEIAIGEIDGKSVIYRHKTRFKGDGDYTKVPGSELAVRVDGLHTYYELKIPWSSLMVDKVKIEPGKELKFAMVVNENDGVGRVGYLALGDGIVSSKNSSLFKRLYIRN